MTPFNATRSALRVLWCALLGGAAAVALAGCHHAIPKAFKAKDCNKPQPYDRAESIQSLRVPPGIDPPDTHGSLLIPAYNEPTPPPRKLTDPCLDEPPPFATHATPSTPAAPAASPTKSVPSD